MISLLKRCFLYVIALCALAAIPCHGEDWASVTSDAGPNKTYYDLDSLELGERSISLWIMVDFATSVMGVLSRKMHVQMNCEKRTYRFYRQVLYEERFGSGQSYITDIKSTKMSDAASNSDVLAVMNEVCKTRPKPSSIEKS